FMLSTPLICCSMGAATDCSTVSASAPVERVRTCISGGTLLGSCATGSASMQTPPISVIKIAMTMATMGLSTKNFDTRNVSYFLGSAANGVAVGCGGVHGFVTTATPS